MTIKEAEWEAGNLDSEYADFIMQHCGGDRPICNGNDLVVAMESHYLLEKFLKEELICQ